MAAGDQIWRQVKQGPHREHFPALWRALPFVLPPIPSQRSRSFPGLTMRSQVLQSAIFSCIMQTAYRFVGVELRFRHPASRKHGGRDVHLIKIQALRYGGASFVLLDRNGDIAQGDGGDVVQVQQPKAVLIPISGMAVK